MVYKEGMNNTTPSENSIVKLTKLERAVLAAIVASEYQTDNEQPVGTPVWSCSVTEATAGATPRSAKGALGSLVRKGLAGAQLYDDDGPTCWITEVGWAALKATEAAS